MDLTTHTQILIGDMDFVGVSPETDVETNEIVEYGSINDDPLPLDIFSNIIILNTGSYHLDMIQYMLQRQILSAFQIVSSYRTILFITLYLRLTHLAIDIIVRHQSIGKLCKDFATCMLGIYQIVAYLSQTKSSDAEILHSASYLFSLVTSMLVLNPYFGMLSFLPRKKLWYYILSLYPILVNEIIISIYDDYNHFMLIRSLLMTISMKLYCELLIGESTDLLSTLTYLLHPSSSILGPWHEKEPISSSQVSSRYGLLVQFFNQLYRASKGLVGATVIIVLSLTIGDFREYLDETLENNVINSSSKIYFIAQEFRFSHYFVCYLSTTMISIFREDNFKACDMLKVEWPRSLVEVVVSWNIPMHRWLKEHIFKPMLKRIGISMTVLMTYLYSSTLHGFKFHIWSVLFTLGAATYSEHRLRHKLATRYSACILSRPCKLLNRRSKKNACINNHKLTDGSYFIVGLINLAFRLLAMAQLAYLGSIFVGNTDEATYTEALDIWSKQCYFGHWMCLLMCLASFII